MREGDFGVFLDIEADFTRDDGMFGVVGNDVANGPVVDGETEGIADGLHADDIAGSWSGDERGSGATGEQFPLAAIAQKAVFTAAPGSDLKDVVV